MFKVILKYQKQFVFNTALDSSESIKQQSEYNLFCLTSQSHYWDHQFLAYTVIKFYALTLDVIQLFSLLKQKQNKLLAYFLVNHVDSSALNSASCSLQPLNVFTTVCFLLALAILLCRLSKLATHWLEAWPYDLLWSWNVSGHAIACMLMWFGSAHLELLSLLCLENRMPYIVTVSPSQPQNKIHEVKKTRYAEPKRVTQDQYIQSILVSHWNLGIICCCSKSWPLHHMTTTKFYLLSR